MLDGIRTAFSAYVSSIWSNAESTTKVIQQAEEAAHHKEMNLKSAGTGKFVDTTGVSL